MKNRHYWLMALASACSALTVYVLVFLLAPGAKDVMSSSDAIAIANTYIVLTTLLVTIFAIFVALATLFLSQNSAEMKMLKLQQEFEEHLATDDKYAKKLKQRAESLIQDQMKEVAKQSMVQNMVDIVVKSATSRLSAEKDLSDGVDKLQSDIAATGNTNGVSQ